MCTRFEGEPEVLKEEITIFKRAPGGQSEYTPGTRSDIDGFADKGAVLSYPVGASIKSPSGPGIMGYVQRERWMYGSAWLELRIPVGATVRKGTNTEYEVVAASEVVVVAKMFPRD